ncbi:2-aminoethylphosphonate--pyruvate transaminase [Chitinibacteraceae bacterium HSL-7]
MQAPILLTPGPLTTSLHTRTAMLTDWGSWDRQFNELTASVCADLLGIVHNEGSHVCVPLQGSGTFAVEATIGTLVPRSGKLLVLANGAYGQRITRIAEVQGLAVQTLSWPDGTPVDASAVARTLASDASISHVALVHCETGTGLLNPLPEIAAVVHAAGRALIVDAMSSFGALDIDVRTMPLTAVIAASGKCLEGVPGMGFVVVARRALEAAQGNSRSLALDLADQHAYMQRTGQWRFTPPTHVVAALRAALDQYRDEGGQPARLARYQANATALVAGLARSGIRLFLDPALQAPIILTFHAPTHPGYDFRTFYEAVRARGFVLYPGKLTEVETFRVGCIGAIDQAEITQAVHAITDTLHALGWLAR